MSAADARAGETVLTAVVSDGALDALVAGVARGVPAILPATDVDVLTAAAALTDARPTGILAGALEARTAPVCELALTRGPRSGRGWVDGDAALLATPAQGGVSLTAVPTPMLPDVLARMNDVAPRPRLIPATTVALEPGALASAVAQRSAEGCGLPAEHVAVLDRSLRGLREHWSVEVRWTPSASSPGVRVVEVLDTDAGLWLVVPDGPTVELWPTTPTEVFRLLAALLPRDHELAAS